MRLSEIMHAWSKILHGDAPSRTLTSLPAHENASDLTSRIHQLDQRNITAAEHAVLNGVAEMMRRIEPSAPIRYLTDCEVNNTLNADSHRYKISAEDAYT